MSLLKCKDFQVDSSARVKICQIPQINVKTTSESFFKFCIILHCHDSSVSFKLKFGLKS